MKNCVNKQENLKNCTCTYEPCARKGICCECIAYHRSNNQLPACVFSSGAEKTFDRSARKYISCFK